jgi:hypothetical protein
MTRSRVLGIHVLRVAHGLGMTVLEITELPNIGKEVEAR